MPKKCNIHNTDYITKKHKYLIKRTENEIVIWTAPNQCKVIKQLVLPFKLT